jgi:hypothetical protein
MFGCLLPIALLFLWTFYKFWSDTSPIRTARKVAGDTSENVADDFWYWLIVPEINDREKMTVEELESHLREDEERWRNIEEDAW